MVTKVYVLDAGGPKDSENTQNSFLTKCGRKGFWQIGADMVSDECFIPFKFLQISSSDLLQWARPYGLWLGFSRGSLLWGKPPGGHGLRHSGTSAIKYGSSYLLLVAKKLHPVARRLGWRSITCQAPSLSVFYLGTVPLFPVFLFWGMIVILSL